MKITGSGVHICCRQGCVKQTVDGFGFCEACLAWLRIDTDEDPLADQRAKARQWGMP